MHAAVRGLLSLEEAMGELEVVSLLALLAGTKVQILTHARARGDGRARGTQFTCFTGCYKCTNTGFRWRRRWGEREVFSLLALLAVTSVQILAFAGGGGGESERCSVCLLYWLLQVYKYWLSLEEAVGRARGVQFACFTGWCKSTNTDTRARRRRWESERH